MFLKYTLSIFFFILSLNGIFKFKWAGISKYLSVTTIVLLIDKLVRVAILNTVYEKKMNTKKTTANIISELGLFNIWKKTSSKEKPEIAKKVRNFE